MKSMFTSNYFWWSVLISMNLHNDIVKSFRFRSPLFSWWNKWWTILCFILRLLRHPLMKNIGRGIGLRVWHLATDGLCTSRAAGGPPVATGARGAMNLQCDKHSHEPSGHGWATAGPRFWRPSTWRTRAGLMLSPFFKVGLQRREVWVKNSGSTYIYIGRGWLYRQSLP